MKSEDGSLLNFGLLIAYILPGFTAIRGLPFLTDGALGWGFSATEVEPTVSGLVSGTLQAFVAGLTVSAIRWLVIDAVHRRTGIEPPKWNFALLVKNPEAFELLVDVHYRYYKFYANMVVALTWATCIHGIRRDWSLFANCLLICLFFFCSRDTLRKYYERSGQLLGAIRADQTENLEN